ncbi:MAG TPA: methylamine utilization protein [Quisquiliibacterium sp.]|nr:methylamine utilization protein [Quisquiliibacterium sp.]HQD81883.1 methylamine utilization protein [Quisquiliibacterium sp.]HQN11487.1 methylamine utilization protein [Quisquiliibacterium sp.]HQP65506.1 methylamine utilization protein [Quisquiliibacterium sp.]
MLLLPSSVVRFGLALAAGGCAALSSHACAGDLAARVRDAQGRPIEDAVVWAMPLSGQSPPRDTRAVTIVQRDKRFIPRVTPVQVGTAVQFPNEDTVRHHVYSFSPAKVFSLKLYVGTPPNPVVFDKAGEVVLGCNIHDQMLAFVYGVDTPYFARSGADGAARIANLLPGDYALHVWHPDQSAAAAAARVSMRATGTVEHTLGVTLSERPRTAARP